MIKRVVTYTTQNKKVSKEDFEYAKKVCRAENCIVKLYIANICVKTIQEEDDWNDFVTSLPITVVKEIKNVCN